MRKIILFLFLSCCISIIVFNSNSFCATQAQIDSFVEFCESHNFDMTNNNASQIIDIWSERVELDSYPRIYCFIGQTPNSNNKRIILANSYSVGSNFQIANYDDIKYTSFATDIQNITYTTGGNTGLNSSTYFLLGSWEEFNTGAVDFDNIYYSPNIPLPEMDVYYVLTSGGGGSKVAIWNSEMSIKDNSNFYIQYGYKITVPGLVGIGLDSSTGKYDYSYESYSEGTYVDYVSLGDLQQCIDISFGSAQMSTAWQTAYDNMYDVLPDFYAKIPFWVQNPNAAKYVEAQEYYKDYMMTQLPMFGNRLELFARFFTINEDNQVIVGDWLHWSSRTGSRTQEKPSNYIDNVELPGYVNSSNNVNLESQDNTYQQSGEYVGAATVINNNYAPNYPDYPTIASYNKDNLLLDTMGYMSNMNNFLSGPNGFGNFLTDVFTFIPSYVWGMVAMGFGVAIIVMFIKML